MSGEAEFFTLDEKRAELVFVLSEIVDIAPQNPEEVPNKLQELQEKFAKAEQRLLEDFRTLFIEQRENLMRNLQQLLGDSYMDKFNRCFNTSLETADDADFKEVALSCTESLSSLIDFNIRVCSHIESFDEEVKRICSLVRDYSFIVEHYRNYQELREKINAFNIVSDSITKGEIRDEYKLILEVAKLYSCSKEDWFCTPKSLIRKMNNTIVFNESIFNLLKGIREITGVGSVDLIRAYSLLMKYATILVEKIEGVSWFTDEILRRLFRDGPGAALSYVLAHVDGRIDLNEVARELEIYVSLNRGEKKKPELYLDLIKIMSLPLCLTSEIDWRLAVSLAFSASRYWRRWNDTVSFIELCRGLRTLSQYASKEEVERVLVYASLFGDYDFIIKLYPLLNTYGSLRELASRIF